ncbi:DUF6210 family protein [Verrucomicrobiota bacterium sgz303538]
MNFHEEQEQLSVRVRDGGLRLVYLDPDGTWADWSAVVIRWPTGVAYATQCGGVACKQRIVEGYLVPLSGSRFDPDAGQLSSALFRDVFHRGTACIYTWTGADVPADRLTRLDELIRDVPYWRHSSIHESLRERLGLDRSRLSEICEGWVPVLTPDGAGVFLFDNCD